MRDQRLYLDDMLEAIAKIERYTKGMELEDFKDNPMAMDAVVLNSPKHGLVALETWRETRCGPMVNFRRRSQGTMKYTRSWLNSF
jgi:hypothetical protein